MYLYTAGLVQHTQTEEAFCRRITMGKHFCKGPPLQTGFLKEKKLPTLLKLLEFRNKNIFGNSRAIGL